MEYIDKEKILNVINKWDSTVKSEYDVGYNDCLSAVEDTIVDLPAADVVEVVRCKDCKYAFHHPLGCIYCHRDGRNSYEMVFEKDSFCSYGERKDGE